MARIGFGYDSHRFVEGRPLILGGIRIPHPRGLAGHSDADVVLHALTDAILGALAVGDIGQHFPDDQVQWESADSSTFLRHALSLVAQEGLVIANCDLCILAEEPKLGVHKQEIADRTADLAGLDSSQVSVKAKTNEGMGFVGRGEGIAAYAVVLLEDRA